MVKLIVASIITLFVAGCEADITRAKPHARYEPFNVTVMLDPVDSTVFVTWEDKGRDEYRYRVNMYDAIGKDSAGVFYLKMVFGDQSEVPRDSSSSRGFVTFKHGILFVTYTHEYFASVTSIRSDGVLTVIESQNVLRIPPR